jgi:hypothetical protein
VGPVEEAKEEERRAHGTDTHKPPTNSGQTRPPSVASASSFPVAYKVTPAAKVLDRADHRIGRTREPYDA